jgi:plasmid stabilization system protein ParE
MIPLRISPRAAADLDEIGDYTFVAQPEERPYFAGARREIGI